MRVIEIKVKCQGSKFNDFQYGGQVTSQHGGRLNQNPIPDSPVRQSAIPYYCNGCFTSRPRRFMVHPASFHLFGWRLVQEDPSSWPWRGLSIPARFTNYNGVFQTCLAVRGLALNTVVCPWQEFNMLLAYAAAKLVREPIKGAAVAQWVEHQNSGVAVAQLVENPIAGPHPKISVSRASKLFRHNPIRFFLWSYVKDNVYRTLVPDLATLQQRIFTVIASIPPVMLTHVRTEVEYRLNVLCVTQGLHVETYSSLVTKANTGPCTQEKRDVLDQIGFVVGTVSRVAGKDGGCYRVRAEQSAGTHLPSLSGEAHSLEPSEQQGDNLHHTSSRCEHKLHCTDAAGREHCTPVSPLWFPRFTTSSAVISCRRTSTVVQSRDVWSTPNTEDFEQQRVRTWSNGGNAKHGETGEPRENPPANGKVGHVLACGDHLGDAAGKLTRAALI
ncbi:hypothetical protein PR048_014797 [Dryococelus australis]|uniref:Uncharacterized protein n=1 Tax=Dryococelus australis TaxID=614101 RepID=A0ABQ9HF65_9NEOP|nr:hypothetical protein PR048_014797 [Dryococelus australis]